MVPREDPEHVGASIDPFDNLDQQVYCLFLGHGFRGDLPLLTQQHVVELSDTLLLLFELEAVLVLFFPAEPGHSLELHLQLFNFLLVELCQFFPCPLETLLLLPVYHFLQQLFLLLQLNLGLLAIDQDLVGKI